MAFLGMIFGSGVAWIGVPGDGGISSIPTLYAVPTMNLFYFILLLIGPIQKHFLPDNKIANYIRVILKWSCLRT